MEGAAVRIMIRKISVRIGGEIDGVEDANWDVETQTESIDVSSERKSLFVWKRAEMRTRMHVYNSLVFQ